MSTSPQLLDKYELRERLGSSNTTEEVWKAFDPQQQCSVTIRLLHANLQTDPDFPPRFLGEAGRIASLHHPNIVQVRDFRISRSPLRAADAAGGEKTFLVDPSSAIGYMVMEYVEGQTLADYIHNTSHQGKFPPAAEIVRLLIPISLAVDYAHQQGMLHGHLKPSNILLDTSTATVNPMGQPMLTGFGTTHLLRTSSSSSQAISCYTAPEQAEGHAANERSDLYSLGVILYEIFTGVLPFEGDNPDDTRMKLINTSPTSPVLINPNIPPALTVVILRSLAKDPAARYPNAAAMVVALAKALNIAVPESLHAASTPVDAKDMPTYFSPLPPSRPLGMTPSSPAFSGMGSSSSIPVIGTATTPAVGYQQSTPLHSSVQGPAASSPYTPLLTPTSGYSEAPPLQATNSPTQVPTQLSTQASSQAQPVPPARKKSRRGLYIALTALLIIALIGSALLVFVRNPFVATAQPLVGHVSFASSGLLSLNSSQGITDQLQITLQNIPNPASSKSYYAWLLNDKGADPAVTPPISLGQLHLTNGAVSLPYPGTTDHKDLLASYSRFLITEEDASAPPSNPSLDPGTWRYYAEFSAVPNPKDTAKQYSLRDHIRHLLADDPTLKTAGLTGGLDIWLFRNTEKVLEWSGSARDTTNTQFIRRQVVRILDYLDGEAYVGNEVPAGTPLLVDQTIARIPLLQSVQGQTPSPYVVHIGNHLREISQSPNVTPDQVTLAIRINTSINNVKARLDQVHKDALLLINMSDAELSQPSALTLLNDMTTQANNAFAGQIDPATNQVVPGAAQIHYDIQHLATFDVIPCVVNGANSCTL